jgi:hypothetical protein
VPTASLRGPLATASQAFSIQATFSLTKDSSLMLNSTSFTKFWLSEHGYLQNP